MPRDLALPHSLAAELRDMRRRLDTLERSPRYFTDYTDGSGAYIPLVESAIETFNISANTIATLQSRTSATYGDLTTTGPTLTVNVSPTGNLLVIAGALIAVNLTRTGAMSFALSGANTLAADDTRALLLSVQVSGLSPSTEEVQASAAAPVLLTGLNEGSTTITAKYRGDGASAADFSNRTIIAIPF